MRTATKLTLLDLPTAQIIAPILVVIPCMIYLVATTGNLDKDTLITMLMTPAQLADQLVVDIYLWRAGCIGAERITWSPVSSSYLLFGTLTILTHDFVVSALAELMKWVPSITEQPFDIFQSDWGSILAIAVIDPMLEELLFRETITKVLLQQYSPAKAILLSTFLFSIFHISPAQILPAFLIGIPFAWTYYKTISLIPCILMRILSNSLSVFLNIKYPEAESTSDLMDASSYLIAVFVIVLMLARVTRAMHHTIIRYPWREKTNIAD